ncbi:DUF3833 family protein [Paludibacterium paludis]|uniref:Uncharacterized protein n=1 Tax=Paludibacterium paludis TaxID=1225769 RepID=A0A918U9M3_9NEIS|nr:DUF3833 family protein [Paludibacterium paludis]GGY14574.1 hypothetical protein GCM10011289_17370 [Paludibacterium paludis]
MRPTASLAAVTSPAGGDYAANRPQLDPDLFFLGKTEARGMSLDRQGRLVKRFTVNMNGEHRGGVTLFFRKPEPAP